MNDTLLISDVVRLTGWSENTIRRRDRELRPARTPGGVRVYDRAVVEAFAQRPVGRSRKANSLTGNQPETRAR